MSLADEVRIRFMPFSHKGSDRSERTNATYVQADTVDRIAKFLDGKESKAYDRGVLNGAKEERERLADLIDKRTRHYGQTHYKGMNCTICHVLLIVDGEEQ